MTGLRLTIAGGMGLVTIAGIGLAALRSPTVLWAQIVITAALTAVLIATVGAAVGRPRAFWVGFAIVGWAYLSLSLGPWCSERVAPWLVSTRILDEIFLRVIAQERNIGGVGLRQAHPFDGPATGWLFDFEYLRFRHIGHGLATIAHGAIGGVVGLLLARDRRRP